MNDSVAANGCSPDAIGGALSRVLASEGFANSKRLQRFLTYAVERTLSDRVDEIKEYNIAIAVFDRDPSFDPRLDSIVRVEARRLRQQLANYYQVEGRLDPIVIRLPKGSYVPAFDSHAAVSVEDLVADFADSTAPMVVAGQSPKRRTRIFLVAAIVLFFSTAAFVLQRVGVLPGARIPNHWRLDGSKLVILDARERVCWSRQFSPQYAPTDPYPHDTVLVADIDDDGRTEVLFDFRPEGMAEKGGSLLCFEQNGKPRWESHYGSRKTFAGRTFDPSFVGRFVRLVRSSGRPLLLTVANHYLWHPSQTALLDPRTGKVVEEYWHPGAVYFLVLQDLDGDRQDEILLGAINNPGTGLGHAALAVLKIPFSRAAAQPLKPANPFPPITGGGEMAYVLFPLADMSKVMGHLPIMTRLNIDQNRRILVQLPLPDLGSMVYYLSFDLRVLEHRFADNTAAIHDRYYKQRLLDHALSNAETEALSTVRYFAAAPDGNSAEVEKLWRW